MSPAAPRLADRSEAVDRFVREVKENPTKAAGLFLGVLVALWVWIPRLLPAADAGAPPQPRDSNSDGSFDPSGIRPDLSTRDSLAIRTEFIAISEETRRVRRFADPWIGEKCARDPFTMPEPKPDLASDAENTARDAAAEMIAATNRLEAEVAAGEAAAQAELARAEALELKGVFEFGADKKALLKGRIVRVGDVVDEFTVIAIGTRALTLRGEHDVYERRLKDPLDRQDERQEER